MHEAQEARPGDALLPTKTLQGVLSRFHLASLSVYRLDSSEKPCPLKVLQPSADDRAATRTAAVTSHDAATSADAVAVTHDDRGCRSRTRTTVAPPPVIDVLLPNYTR